MPTASPPLSSFEVFSFPQSKLKFQVVGSVFLNGGRPGIDVVFDDVAFVYLFDLLEEGVSFEACAEVADFHLEVGFVVDDIGLHRGIV